MSFADDFVFPPDQKWTEIAKQIGNAVPPLLAAPDRGRARSVPRPARGAVARRRRLEGSATAFRPRSEAAECGGTESGNKAPPDHLGWARSYST